LLAHADAEAHPLRAVLDGFVPDKRQSGFDFFTNLKAAAKTSVGQFLKTTCEAEACFCPR
jgi:hypothetical protein